MSTTIMSTTLQRFGSLRLSLVKKDRVMVSTSQPTKVVFRNKRTERAHITEERGEEEKEALMKIKVGERVGEEEEDSVGSCVICVGSTGTGKSSTIAKYTGSKTKSGSGFERVTKNCEIHRCIQDDSSPVWVDTVGWDDAECEDDETFKDILRFIDKFNITKVKCVIWNISPNVRRDALLTGQARLINMFQERIWSNVIVVAKQSLNPDHDCQGALKAAEQYTQNNILHTGYRFYEDPTLTPKQREVFICPETRLTYNIKTDAEVQKILGGMLSELGAPVQVVFKTKRCLVCGVTGDPRLLTAFCHMEDVLVHPGAIQNHHPGVPEQFHPSSHHVIEHDGRLKKNWYSAFCCGTLRKPRYTCCRRRSGKEGCRKKWACCKAKWESKDELGCQLRYTCCGSLVSLSSSGCSPRYVCCSKNVNTIGCKKVCKKCGNDWGSAANKCFRKDHVLVDISERGAEVEPEGSEVEICLAPEARGSQDQSQELQPFIKDRQQSTRKSFIKLKKLPPVITYHMF